jgi:4-hydroxybenzoyl-CoA reductase subunit beta
VVMEHFPILSQAAAKVGTPQLRNRGTIGGNICIDSRCLYFNQASSWKKNLPICFKAGGKVCHVAKGGSRCFAVFCADTVPVLIALAARVRISASETERVIPLEELYRKDGDGRRVNNLETNEIITQVEITAPPLHSGGAYLKIGQRKSFDFPIISVATVVQLDTECKFCSNIRIVILAGTPNPLRANEAEEVVRGREVSEELIEEASKLVRNSIRPISNAGGFAWYRKTVLPRIVARSIRQALEAARAK